MTAIYPGSFDPVTRGHMDIIERAARITDRLIVAVLDNPLKRPLFTVDERIAFLKSETQSLLNVEIDAFSGLLAVYATQKKANVIIRGVRSSDDVAIETQRAQTNRVLSGGLETLLMTSDPGLTYVSSRAVREIAGIGYRHNGGFNEAVLDAMVSPAVKEALRHRYAEEDYHDGVVT